MPTKKQQLKRKPQPASKQKQQRDQDRDPEGELQQPQLGTAKRPRSPARADPTVCNLHAVMAATVAQADIALELCFEALKAIRGTEDVLDPALSFPKATKLLRGLKQERFEPFIAVLATAAAHVGGGSGATLTRSYVAILPFCITMELFVLNYDPKEPLTHPATVLASLCAAHIPVPLLENPTTADVADHFDVPLQGCEQFFTELADVCVSVLEEPPTTLQASRALVLQNATGCGKTYKALAIVSGLARLLSTADGDRYAALRGRRVVPLYVGFDTTAALTDHERKYITAGGEGALECVLYARIAAAATAVSMDPSLVALPENGGALSKTLSVPKKSVKNLELLHCHHLKNMAMTALCSLVQTEALKGAEGEPPLVVIVVDDAVSVAAVVGGRTALRVCRELQVEVKLRGAPVVGLVLDADPRMARPVELCVSAEAELPTEEEFAAIVAAGRPGVSASACAVICAVQHPRLHPLCTSRDHGPKKKQKTEAPDDSATTTNRAEALAAAVRASLTDKECLVNGHRVMDVPYRGDFPKADFRSLLKLHTNVSKTPHPPEMGRMLRRSVPRGEDDLAFEAACAYLLTIAAEFVMTGTLGKEIGEDVYEFLNIEGFTGLERMSFENLRCTKTNPHPLRVGKEPRLTTHCSAVLHDLHPNHAVLFRAGMMAPWDFVLVVNVGGTLHFRYAEATNANRPILPKLSVQEWHHWITTAAVREGFNVAEATAGAMIVRVPTARTFAPAVKLDQESWRMGSLSKFLFLPKYHVKP